MQILKGWLSNFFGGGRGLKEICRGKQLFSARVETINKIHWITDNFLMKYYADRTKQKRASQKTPPKYWLEQQ